MQNQQPARERFERTECGCAGCRVGCKTMPGSLTVGDAARIAEYRGEEYGRDFMVANFRLSTGCKVGTWRRGVLEVEVLPTITPAQREDGRCVFLTDDERCGVHPVSPMGCSHCDIHQSAAEGDGPVRALMTEVMQDRQDRGTYYRECSWLAAAGRESPNVEGRRQSFEIQLRLLREAGLVPYNRQPSEPHLAGTP